jgi:hypothetical protein
MSGLAEWLVENWTYLLWEIRTPFPKPAASLGAQDVPGLADADGGWAQHALEDEGRVSLAVWQHRHSLGHAASDIALPSITFLPEENQVGLFVRPAPLRLDPSVQFAGEARTSWIAKDDFQCALREFVLETVRRAECDESGKTWAGWLASRYQQKEEEAKSEEVRVGLMFGSFVAEQWRSLAGELAPASMAVLRGLLLDSALVQSEEPFRELLGEATRSDTKTATSWQSVGFDRADGMLPPFEQGYRLAKRARRALSNEDGPVVDLTNALAVFDLTVREFAYPLFRSAVVTSPQGAATMLVARDPDRGVAPTRFAMAAALGRLLAEGRPGQPLGAAHGEQSRWIQTQRANAFAAEFLLPTPALSRPGDLEAKCDQYGISRTAARWHMRNRVVASELFE